MEKVQSNSASEPGVRYRVQPERLEGRSPFYFIATPLGNKRYENTLDFGGVDFIISTSIEDHKVSNRIATVRDIPLLYSGPIRPGDQIIVHHNVFKFYNDTAGRTKSGRSHFKGDVFMIEEDHVFMYKRDEDWIPLDKFCFIKPSKKKSNHFIEKLGTLEPLYGTVAYGNRVLQGMGINEGDEVVFAPESEYEFRIDGEVLYRVFTKDICIKL